MNYDDITEPTKCEVVVAVLFKIKGQQVSEKKLSEKDSTLVDFCYHLRFKHPYGSRGQGA